MEWEEILQRVRDETTVALISTEELEKRLKGKTAPVLLDIRKAEEYAVSHLPGARLMLPDSNPAVVLADLDKDTELVVYCSVGIRSARMARKLEEAGFRNVENLEGSIFKWANEGRPVYRESKEVEVVHPFNKKWGRLLDETRHQY